MAMNKAEKARVEALETELAFRWPTEKEPERLPAAERSNETEGWDFNAYTATVERRWATSTSNGSFYQGKRMSGSQGGKRLYATEADALLAMRWAMCRDFAKRLRDVDLRAALSREVKP